MRVRRVATRVAPMKVRKECGERSPRSRLCRASPPLGKGAMGTGVRIATASLRTGFAMTYTRSAVVIGGGVRARRPTERLQVVRQSGRTEASVPTERLHEVRWAGRCRHRPLRRVASSAVGRADRVVRPYGAIRGVVRDRVGRPQGSPLRKRYKGCSARQAGGRKGHPYESVIRGAVQDRRATARVTPTEGLQKAQLVLACRIRIHTHIHYIHPQKPRRVCRPQAAKKFKSFFTATCAWGKIPLRLPVWNFAACDKIMRAADCKPLWQKIP